MASGIALRVAVLSLLSTGISTAETHVAPDPPKAPSLEWLFTANLSVEAGAIVGQGPFGLRTVAPLSQGSIHGPDIKGMC